MAPITRRGGSGIVKPVHRKASITGKGAQGSTHQQQTQRVPSLRKDDSGSWEVLGVQEQKNVAHEADLLGNSIVPLAAEIHDNDLRAPVHERNGFGSTKPNGREDTASFDGDAGVVADAVNPLREMAERVGREVETFAETLDKFFTDLAGISDSPTKNFENALELVSEFRDIADEAVDALKREHEHARVAELRREWTSHTRIEGSAAPSMSLAVQPATGPKIRNSAQVAQLRRWQQEADLWELFRLILEAHPPDEIRQAQTAARKRELDRLGPPHRYTSDADVWDRFLSEEDMARERFQVKQWLERSIEHQESDVEAIMEELEARASKGSGKGMWTAGWLYTRERIKGEKRLRSWPKAAESPLPQIRRSDSSDLLVTALDPDAPARQQRVTEKPDVYSERALWIVCWELLRRGKSFQEICDWCEDRKEGWRAVSLGRTSDAMDGAVSTAAWRRACFALSESKCSSEYEAAVYGLLGGNLRAVLRVCRTFDDHLFAHYSCALVRQLDAYVSRTFPERTVLSKPRPLNEASSAAEDEKLAEQAIVDLLSRLRKGAATKAEASKPMNTVQGYLLGNMAPSLVTTVGAMLALAASKLPEDETQDLIEIPPYDIQLAEPETAVALDPHTLRIVAHMAIILRLTHPEQLDPRDLVLEENVLVAYVQALRTAGKRDAIPLYASQLQHDRYSKALGRIMEDVTSSKEQREMLQLLAASNLDVPAILDCHLKWTLRTALSGEALDKPLKILEMTSETKLWPGRRIMQNFMSDELLDKDEAVLNCLQWFMLFNGHWAITFAALSAVMRKCLITGRFACARAIVNKMPYESVSTRKSYEAINRTINVMNEQSFRPSSESERIRLTHLQRQSQTYYELELLVRAVESLSEWRAQEAAYLEKVPRPSSVPAVLKHAKDTVSAAMQPICNGILLNAIDDAEAADLAIIRRTYLPEILIAYCAVLQAAGNFITRENLLESMDLSATIAHDENGLADAVRKARRMRELVTVFALTSRAMLILKAEGKPWKPRKDTEGRDLGIWEIAQPTPEEDEDMDDANAEDAIGYDEDDSVDDTGLGAV